MSRNASRLRRPHRFAVALLAMTVCAPAFAQTQDVCASFAWPIGDAQKAMAGDVARITSGGAAPRDFVLALVPTEQASFPTRPERAPKNPGTFGGFVTTDAPQGRLLQVTLSEDAWVDVVQGGAIVKSAAFSGKAGCEGVRKSLRFALPGAGPVTVQVSGAEARSVRVDVRGVE